jgi:hypothetical protein
MLSTAVVFNAVAGYFLSLAYRSQLWLFVQASFNGVRATSGETATGWQMDWAWRVAFHGYTPDPFVTPVFHTRHG